MSLLGEIVDIVDDRDIDGRAPVIPCVEGHLAKARLLYKDVSERRGRVIGYHAEYGFKPGNSTRSKLQLLLSVKLNIEENFDVQHKIILVDTTREEPEYHKIWERIGDETSAVIMFKQARYEVGLGFSLESVSRDILPDGGCDAENKDRDKDVASRETSDVDPSPRTA